jgi:hypothetical protein
MRWRRFRPARMKKAVRVAPHVVDMQATNGMIIVFQIRGVFPVFDLAIG